jgi:hypothetical protein
MKKKSCLSVYIALLFLIFLVVLFPYKEGFESTVTTTTTTGNTTTTTGNTTTKNSFFDYFWPFSNKFLQSSEDDKSLNSENGGTSSSEINKQGDSNIDSRTDNTKGYNDVDAKGFNTTGIGNDGTRYK